MKQGRLALLIFVVSIGALCVFHKALLLASCRLLLKAKMKDGYYEELVFEENKIVLTHLLFKNPSLELTVDRATLELVFDWTTFSLHPYIEITHPEIIFYDQSSSSSSLPLLYRSSWIKPHWTVTNAVIQWDTTRLYGAFAQKEGSLGQLLLSSDPDLEALPLLRVDVKEQEQDLSFEFELHEQDLASSLSLCKHLFNTPLLDQLSMTGQVQGEGHCVLSSLHEIKEMAMQVVFDKVDAGLHAVSVNALQGRVEVLLLPERNVLSLQSDCTATLFHIDHALPLTASFQGELKEQEHFSLKGELLTHGTTSFECQGSLSQGGKLTWVAKEWQQEECDLCFPQISCKDGSLNFEAVLTFSPQDWTSLELHQVQGTKLTLYQEQRSFFAKQILLDAELSPKGLSSLHAEIAGGEYLDSHLQVYAIEGKVNVVDSVLQPSFLQWEWNQSPFNLTYQGDKQWELAGTIDVKSVLPFLSVPLPCEFVAKGTWEEGELTTVVNATLFQDEMVGEILWKIPSFTVQDLMKGELPLFSVHKGVVHATTASLETYRQLFPVLQATGKLDIDALFNSTTVALQIGGTDLAFVYADHPFSLPSLVKEKTRIVYEEGIVSLSLPLEKMKIDDQEISCHFNGSYDLQEKIGEGKLSHLFFPVNPLTCVKDAQIEWSASSSYLKIHMAEGKWEDWDWKLRPITLSYEKPSDFSFSLFSGRKELALLEGTVDLPLSRVTFHSKTTRLLSTPLNIEPVVFKAPIAFEMRPSLHFEELPALVHIVEHSGFMESSFPVDQWKGQGKGEARIRFDEATGEWTIALASADAKWQGTPCHPLRLQAHYLSSQWMIDQLQIGKLSLKGVVQALDDGIRLSSIEGNQDRLSFKGSALFRPNEDKLSCSFEKIRYDLQEEGIKGQIASSLQLTAFLGKGQISGQAHLLMQLKEPFVCNFANEKVLSFTYSEQEGLKVASPRFVCTAPSNGAYLATVSSSQFFMPKWGFASCTALEVKATRLLLEQMPQTHSFTWEKELVVSGDLQIKPHTYAFQGELAAGRYGYHEHSLPFEQIQCFLDPSTLHLRWKTSLEEHPLWGTLQLKKGKQTFGTLQLFDHPKAKGLQVTFRTSSEKTEIEAIEGACYGLESHLSLCSRKRTQGITPLSGTLSFDLATLSSLLPATTQQKLAFLKLGSGYKWTGEIFLPFETLDRASFQGVLQAREFSLLGYQLAKMDARLSGSIQKIQLAELTLQEQQTTLEIPTCTLVKKQEDYTIDIPTLRIAHLQPSALRKTDKKETPLKPFVIQQFALTHLSGKLSDVRTFAAEGKLTFVNQFKKESSLFDFPLEMIKKMGLDLSVLTPVEGEAALELRGDKFYLISLDKAYSEKQLSSFYLTSAQEPSYIDLNGNVHIDLKMHQETVFKVIEPFTLTVRGTLDKPRYGLQF